MGLSAVSNSYEEKAATSTVHPMERTHVNHSSLTPSPDRRKVKALLLLALILSAVGFSAFPSLASALTENRYSGQSLAGHTWTTGNGVVLSNEDLIAANANTTSSVCVGPVTYDGSFHMPYGWSCATHNVQWTFSPITAAAGFYNPNSGTVHEFNVQAWGQ